MKRITDMASTVDPTDVPEIAPRDLALAVRMMLAGGRVLAAAGGFSEGDIRRVEQAFWTRNEGCHASKLAVLLRFRSLIGVFSTRRMNALLARYGSALVPHALDVAATMRLNTKWGFNPQKFARALEAALAQAGAFVAPADDLPAAA